MIRTRLPMSLLVALALAMCVLAAKSPPTDADRAALLVEDGAWCWFADPRAVRRGDTTFIGFVDRTGSVKIAAYDHKTGGLNVVTLHEKLNRDDHANPAILIRNDGRLMVFYSGHSRAPMRLRVSKKPLDITEWGKETSLPSRGAVTYPNPAQLIREKGRIYLLHRGSGQGGSGNVFVTSDDGGTTWSKPRCLIAGSRPYFKMVSDGVGRIHLAYNNSHPHNYVNNVYYLCYHDGALRKADGTKIKDLDQLPIKPEEGDLVYDAKAVGKGRAWVWDIALDDGGQPVIVYATIPDRKHHAYRYARWDGTRWQDREVLADAGGYINGSREWCYSGGIYLDHEDTNVLYLSRQVGDGFQVERWTTSDAGKTWAKTMLAPAADAEHKNVRPFVVRGHQDDLQVLWMRGAYNYWTRYRTGLVGWPMKQPPRRTPLTEPKDE